MRQNGAPAVFSDLKQSLRAAAAFAALLVSYKPLALDVLLARLRSYKLIGTHRQAEVSLYTSQNRAIASLCFIAAQTDWESICSD